MHNLPEHVVKYMDEGCPICGGGGCIAETVTIDGELVTVCGVCAFWRKWPTADPRAMRDEDAASMQRLAKGVRYA